MKTNYDTAAEAYDVMLGNYMPGILKVSYSVQQKRDFVNAVIELASQDYELPFANDPDARNALYRMRLNYNVWKENYQKNASRKCQMLRAACKLCDMNRVNPFSKPEEEVSLDTLAETEFAEMDPDQVSEENLETNLPKIFFGVIDKEDV